MFLWPLRVTIHVSSTSGTSRSNRSPRRSVKDKGEAIWDRHFSHTSQPSASEATPDTPACCLHGSRSQRGCWRGDWSRQQEDSGSCALQEAQGRNHIVWSESDLTFQPQKPGAVQPPVADRIHATVRHTAKVKPLSV